MLAKDSSSVKKAVPNEVGPGRGNEARGREAQSTKPSDSWVVAASPVVLSECNRHKLIILIKAQIKKVRQGREKEKIVALHCAAGCRTKQVCGEGERVSGVVRKMGIWGDSERLRWYKEHY